MRYFSPNKNKLDVLDSKIDKKESDNAHKPIEPKMLEIDGLRNSVQYNTMKGQKVSSFTFFSLHKTLKNT